MARRGELWLVDFAERIGHEQGYRRPGTGDRRLGTIPTDRLNHVEYALRTLFGL